MKKLLSAFILAAITGGVILFFHSCAPSFNLLTLEAQSLPITRTAIWDPNPTSDAVINYTLTLDNGTPASTGMTSQAFTIATAGQHTLHLTATNQWGTSPETTLTFTVVVPVKPANLRIQ